MQTIAAFTDTYLPTVSSVTYTIQTRHGRWHRRNGRMGVVSPADDDYDPESGEYGVRSLPSLLYEGIRIGAPRILGAVDGVDVVHVHTPFNLGPIGF